MLPTTAVGRRRFERNRARRIPRNKRRLKMPNWCHNSMTITGSVDEIARFKQMCLLAHKDGPTLDFEAIKPMPGIFYDDPGQILFPDPDAPENRERVEAQKAFEARALEATGSAHASDWAREHWGTPGIASSFHVCCDEPGRYECDFDTRWTPPLYIWEKLGEMFPALDFSVEGREPLADFALRGTIKDGELEYELMDQPGIWEAVDSETGKTFSGTLEEIMRAAADDLPIWGAAPVWDDARVERTTVNSRS
jgi:hypothetical protein